MNYDHEAIPPDAREMIDAAARRAGMSVSEWLNEAILDAAAEEGVRPVRYVFREPPEKAAPATHDIAALYSRIDELASKIEALAQSKTGASYEEPAVSPGEPRARPQNTLFDRLAGVLHRSEPAVPQPRRDQRRASARR